MTKRGGIIGLIAGLIIGAAITWYLMRKKAQSASNLELWDMWEESGHIKVKVRRKVKVE